MRCQAKAIIRYPLFEGPSFSMQCFGCRRRCQLCKLLSHHNSMHERTRHSLCELNCLAGR